MIQLARAPYMPFGQYFPRIGPGAITIRAPSSVVAWVTNGSGAQMASTCPFASAVRIVGNGTASSLTELGSTPDF